TATRHNSPRLRRGSNSAARAFPRYVPPPTHLRVRLLCRFSIPATYNDSRLDEQRGKYLLPRWG
ncbi:MAG TPA: hypothetical protein PLH74_03215, partial [Tenuifilaceae bacterium]|nr:hypothetical protein [Tenuifilaceae bacterium]HPH00778.1 hypothetical protein [Tenuifilaceae bacterium]